MEIFFGFIKNTIVINVVTLIGFGITLWQIHKVNSNIVVAKKSIDNTLNIIKNNSLKEVFFELEHQQLAFRKFQREMNLRGKSKKVLLEDISKIMENIIYCINRMPNRNSTIIELIDKIDETIINLEDIINKNYGTNNWSGEINREIRKLNYIININFKSSISKLKELIEKNEETTIEQIKNSTH